MDRKIGRPKKSVDTVRVCPFCEAKFSLPEWNPKQFCSQAHARAFQTGKPRPEGQRIEKICANPDCPLPEGRFFVYPSHHYVKTCSRECSTAYKQHLVGQAVRKMSEGECMWFAGLFDGEGSVVMARRNTDSLGHIRIYVYNTVRPLLERIVEYTGVGYIRERSKQKEHHTQCYYWGCGGGEALEILRQVRPWLIVKAARADAVFKGESFDRQSRWDMIYPEGVD